MLSLPVGCVIISLVEPRVSTVEHRRRAHVNNVIHGQHNYISSQHLILYTSVFQPFLWSGTLCRNFDC